MFTSFRFDSKLVILFFTILGGIFLSSQASANCEQHVGQFVDIQGQVETQAVEGAEWSKADLDTTLCQGSSIRVGAKSRAAISLINDAVLRLDENTTMRLVDITEEEEESSILDIIKGALQSFSRKPKKLAINSPYLNGSIEGTEFVFRVTDDQTQITVFEGFVVAANNQGELRLESGQSAVASEGSAPILRTVVKPRELVQWGLYYPPVLSAEGNADEQRAAELLSLGRVDEARLILESGSNSAAGLALQSVIAIALNDLDSAQDYADRAAAINPINPAVAIASSYVKQAQLELEQALAVIEAALQEESGNALLWARAGELRLMSGRNSEALAAAKKARELDPNSSQANLVNGFAALSTFDTEQAMASFKTAIGLNSADPMGYLGLGLTRISEGDLEAGRHDLEVAVSLDSNNAILRSYLGKAYFEEKRTPLDAQQYSIARELDPLDPTPYLYEGILKQTENDPVGALGDVEKSIELNGNRAVYRSRLLLDSDQAARNLSLARIYSDLGFQQLALVEGYESVNTDPTNSSAHRYLADSYSVLPRHEIARVSELLQSQLLNPLNLQPIQPRAAESNLSLISAGGPATASYNEFNSLFKRNQVNTIVSGMVGEQQTGSGEVVVGGTSDNWSFSLGASRFESDGFRDNNDQSDDIGNAFIQTALSPDTSLQFEYRYRKTENGDLNLLMDESFSTALRGNTESESLRAGLRHAFSPASTLLASVMHKSDDRSFYDEPELAPPGSWVEESRPDDEALGTELQYLYRSEKTNITAGVGDLDLDQIVIRDSFSPPFCVDPPNNTICFGGLNTDTTDVSARHKNAYVYSNTRVVPDLTLTLGASWDSFDTKDASSESQDQTNPKLGITWRVNTDTTLRAAAFKVFKRSLISDQTLEPTQVAGFNQFYDDVAATQSESRGIALDHKFSQRMFAGVQLASRDLTVPLTYTNATVPPPVTSVEHADWKEDSARAFLFMTPSDRLALSMEYHYQRLDQSFSPATDPLLGGDVVAVNKTKAHKVPLGIRFFLDSAWTFALKATYVKEYYDSGTVCALGAPACVVTEQSSDFWLADATVSYRLPKRWGFASFGATNLFDEQFAYQQVDTANTEFQPARMIFGRLTLYFP